MKEPEKMKHLLIIGSHYGRLYNLEKQLHELGIPLICMHKARKVYQILGTYILN